MTSGQTAMAAGCLAAAFLAVSCSTAPPKIAETFWQLNLIRSPQTDRSHESLSFFVHVSDNNGIEDLDSIYLVNDSNQLYWRLDPSSWQYSDKDGELWVGSNTIEMPDLSDLPRGKYRVLLSNLAGERATDDIFLSADRLNPAKAAFPELAVTASSVTVKTAGTALWLYDPSGQLVGTRQGTGVFGISSLVPTGSPRDLPLTIYGYSYDRDCGCGLISGPFSSNQ